MKRRLATRSAFWESGNYFRLLVENADDYAIFSLDLDGRITTWNAGAERLLGWSAEEVVGQKGTMVFTEKDRAAGIPEREMSMAARQGRAEDTRWHTRNGGDRFWANGVLTAIKDDDGQLIGYAKIFRDLTRQKQYEEALENKNRALASSNRRLQAFASHVAHEVRSPLAGLRLIIDVLARQGGNTHSSEPIELAREAQSTLRDLDQFTSDLLTYARLDGNSAPTREHVDVQKTLQDALADVRNELRRSNVVVEAKDLPHVSANPTLLRHLFRNLLSNAVQHNDAPQPRVTVRANETSTAWRFRVADNGVGMDGEALSNLFSLFHRGTEKHTGNGVGLALCKRIVEHHGGLIWAESEPGDGTRFFFTLPKPHEAAA